MFASGEPKLLSYGISDEEAWAVGSPWRRDRRLRRAPALIGRPLAAPATAAARSCSPSSRARLGSKLLVVGGGETLGDGPAELAAHAEELIRGARNRTLELEGRKVFAEVYGPPPRLFVYGAVDTAEALAAAAKLLGWQTVVADARAKFATSERVPSADELIVAWPEEAFAQGRTRPRDRDRDPHPRRQVRPASRSSSRSRPTPSTSA